MGTAMIRHWSHTRQEGWGYPPKKTACQSGLRFQRYKPLKSVTTAGGPLILRFLVYISRNSLRASRSLVIRLGEVTHIFIFTGPEDSPHRPSLSRSFEMPASHRGATRSSRARCGATHDQRSHGHDRDDRLTVSYHGHCLLSVRCNL